jgi:hypothetical protein
MAAVRDVVEPGEEVDKYSVVVDQQRHCEELEKQGDVLSSGRRYVGGKDGHGHRQAPSGPVG